MRLREQFAMLRDEDAAGVPPFRAMIGATRTVRRRRPVIGWVVAAAAVIVLVAVLFATRSSGAIVIDLAAVRWEGPTDFLLHFPGEELLWTLPRFN